MGLLRLLTTGKSLIGVEDTASRYRIPRQRLLPQFGGKANPFRTTARPEPAAGGKRATAAAETAGQVEVLGASSGTACLPSVPPGSRRAGWIARCARRLGSWLGKSRTPPPKRVMAPLGKTLVQAELSLERVTVMRNDLSESDLEVIRVKKLAPLRPTAIPAAAGKARELVGSAWSRASARLLGAGKVQTDG